MRTLSPLMRGLALALAQVLIVSMLGAKLFVDRARYPRVWVETAPVDPNLPIRGRYVRLGLVPDGEHIEEPVTVALFIPEDVADPSIRPAGETLWAEVTVPPAGPPRPIRLGIQRGDGPVEPLDLRAP